MKKPTVFLSHSKKDKQIIERLANDLRKARINVWYDEWEIPLGESFTRKIFEDGIPNCDVFLVYLSINSKDSYWVERELDAAMIRDVDQKGGFLALFVDSDDTRNNLRIDLRSLHSPVLNDQTVDDCTKSLISRVWETATKNIIKEAEKQKDFELLKLQNKIFELENQNLKQNAEDEESEESTLIKFLSETIYTLNNNQYTLLEVFVQLANALAIGIESFSYYNKFYEAMKCDEDIDFNEEFDILGELIIQDLIGIDSSGTEQVYYLSEKGKNFVKHLRGVFYGIG